MNAPMVSPIATEEMIPAWVDGRLQPVGKLEVHQRGLRHKAVSVFVIDGSRVLIQQRALTKYHTPGLWANTCCTHPRWDEDPAACAVRRLREAGEIVLSVLPGQAPQAQDFECDRELVCVGGHWVLQALPARHAAPN